MQFNLLLATPVYVTAVVKVVALGCVRDAANAIAGSVQAWQMMIVAFVDGNTVRAALLSRENHVICVEQAVVRDVMLFVTGAINNVHVAIAASAENVTIYTVHTIDSDWQRNSTFRTQTVCATN